jgi:Conserved domain frequently associated with peptide methionine sulfoxide reductase
MSEIKKDWEIILTKESYLVTREGATERPFSGEYWDHFEDGSYKCICCGTELFK